MQIMLIWIKLIETSLNENRTSYWIMLFLITKKTNNTSIQESCTPLIRMNLTPTLKTNNKQMMRVEIDLLLIRLLRRTCFTKIVECRAKKALNRQELRIGQKRGRLEKCMDSNWKQTTLNQWRFQMIKSIKMTLN